MCPDAAPLSYGIEVQVLGDPGWYSNTLRFETLEEAMLYGLGLAERWALVTDARCVEFQEAPTHELGALVILGF